MPDPVYCKGLAYKTVALCNDKPYIEAMIKSFRHKGIKVLYLTGNTKGMRADHAAWLRRLLAWRDVAKMPDDMDEPAMRLHMLKDELAGFRSVNVSGH